MTKKKKKNNLVGMFCLVGLCLFLGICIGSFIVKTYCCPKPSPEFEFRVIKLPNTNEMLYNVEDFMCSDNVEVSYHKRLSDKPLYISTWEDSEHSNKDGVCLVKIKTS